LHFPFACTSIKQSLSVKKLFNRPDTFLSFTIKKRRINTCPTQSERNAEFVAAMEDVLAVYTRKQDKKRPLVCMDECPKQLIGEARTPLPCGKGKTAKYDTERTCIFTYTNKKYITY
jgi:hypothetical protein